jgi:DNA-binding IclR family transcriptional regulator
MKVRAVPAVSRAIAIMRLLGASETGLGVKAIADELDLIPSTCLHIVRALVEEGLLRFDAKTKHYSLGGGLVALARQVLSGGGFTYLVQPLLDQMAQKHNVIAMGVEVTPKLSALVLALSRSDQPFRLHTDVGSEFKTLESATGRLIAAHSGLGWSELQITFQSTQWDKAVSFDDWRIQVEQAKLQGWAIDRDSFMVGLTVVAVPIFDLQRNLSHTLVAAGLSAHMGEAQVVSVLADLQAAAQEVLKGLYPTN